LLVLLLAASSPDAGPQSSVSKWTNVKGVESRELTFTAKDGQPHVVRFVLSSPKQKKTEDGFSRSRELTVTHSAGGKEVWKARDFVNQCEFDLTLEVVEGSIRLTDLDGDGEPEVSFMYRLACRSDVSPLDAKLLMYEGATKYALRGQTKERVGENEFAGGEFTVDPAFEQAPRQFVEFARAQWKSLIVDTVTSR
jgi:hypothetical protein